MLLSEKQSDALTELINIAFARTAASLSELSGHRVLLDAPTIGVHPIDELPGTIGTLIQDEVATVHQIFTGPVAGESGQNASLDHDRFGGASLCRRRVDGISHQARFRFRIHVHCSRSVVFRQTSQSH